MLEFHFIFMDYVEILVFSFYKLLKTNFHNTLR